MLNDMHADIERSLLFQRAECAVQCCLTWAQASGEDQRGDDPHARRRVDHRKEE